MPALRWISPSELVTLQAEVADACRATACAALDALIASRAVKAAKKVSRRI